MNCSDKKQAAPIAATIGSGKGDQEECVLRSANSHNDYISVHAHNQDQHDGFIELFRLGFSEDELDTIRLHGFNVLQVYVGVLDLLCFNQADESNVHDVFKEALPELFVKV